MRDGQELKAFAPSGPSGGFLPARLPRSVAAARLRGPGAGAVPGRAAPRRGDATSTCSTWSSTSRLFRDLGLMLGAGMVVYGEGANMVDQAPERRRVLPQRVVRQVRPLPARLAEAGRAGRRPGPAAVRRGERPAAVEELLTDLQTDDGDDLDLRPRDGRGQPADQRLPPLPRGPRRLPPAPQLRTISDLAASRATMTDISGSAGPERPPDYHGHDVRLRDPG